jgi:squalene cyclase
MKGVRLLAQAYDLTNDENLKTEAKRAAEFVVSKQRDDGSWGYSLSSEGGWTDNYHTGYVLDCLHEYSLICQDREFDDQLSSGYKFYKYRFVERNGIPRFYAEQTYPVDCTSASQTIFTLNRFGDNELAHSVAAWMISNMQAGNGGFFYRKFRYFTVKTSFMRWSNAWMFAAMAKMNAVLRK